MDTGDDLEQQRSDGVLRLVLNRPDAGNSFNGRMQRDLIDAFEQAERRSRGACNRPHRRRNPTLLHRPRPPRS